MARGRTLSQFQEEFPDEASCAAFLSERRWSSGFVCPGCGAQRSAALKSRAYTYECLDCGRQTSVISGTVMHRSKLPLITWNLSKVIFALGKFAFTQIELFLVGVELRIATRPTGKRRSLAPLGKAQCLASPRTTRFANPPNHETHRLCIPPTQNSDEPFFGSL